MEKLKIVNNGQWSLEDPLAKGAMSRLAPHPDPAMVEDVGGGTGSQYRPLGDENHRQRAAFKLLKDRLSANPSSVKTVDGVPHVLLHRGIDSVNNEAANLIDARRERTPSNFPDMKREVQLQPKKRL